MILVLASLLTFFIVAVILTVSWQQLKNFSFGKISLILGISFLIAGILLIIDSSDEISRAFSRRSWPETMAQVVETNIVGERAYNPQLSCKYEVEGKLYTLTTDLKTPGFGRKRSRRQTAGIILNEYPVGSEVRIYYNLENPKDAYIRTGPYWSDYMKLSLGILLSVLGLYGILGMTINKFTAE
jgi:hypothetical protein